jgi:hypothetical protein
MDTTSEIVMRLLEDLYSGEGDGNATITAEYSKYYDSLDSEQSKIVVSGAIKRLMNENNNVKCQFDDDTFTLIAE